MNRLTVSRLRVFGCPTWYHIKEGKHDPINIEAIFTGYKVGVKGYKIWDLNLEKVVVSHDVSFDDPSLIKPKKSSKVILTPMENISTVVTDDPRSVVLFVTI